mgnify:CR=1 FL=1
MNNAQGPRNIGMGYLQTVMAHHASFWKRGIPTDIVDMESGLTGYKLIVAPMVYLLRADFAKKLREFCASGGTVLGTYWTGVVNDTDLCYLGPTPGNGLAELFGLRKEEIDGLYDGQYNKLLPKENTLPKPEYRLKELCELIRCSTALPLAEYGSDFYAGSPALTVNTFGKGNWTRSGSFAGTSAMIKRQSDGYTWVFITNTSSWTGSKFPKKIEDLMRRALSTVKAFPQRDMFSPDYVPVSAEK